MPQDDEASTQNLIREEGGSFMMEEPQKSAFSCEHHQSMFDNILGLGDLRMKAEVAWLKEITNLEIEGRCEQPSGMVKEQWTSVLRRDLASFLENF
jgi:hypothetical protein